MHWVEGFDAADDQRIPAALLRSPRSPDASWTASELGLPDRMDDEGPLVSVVIPTYEDSEYLPDALESVGAQTHRNLEVLIVDGSGVEWVRELGEQREWIRYIEQSGLGLSAARNDAIERAHGEYVALLDADDYWHPEKLERQVTALEAGEENVSYSSFYSVDTRAETHFAVRCKDREPPKNACLDRIRGVITSQPSTLVFRRSLVSERPFAESLDACEDFVFLVELFRRTHPIHIPTPLCVYRNRNGSITDDTRRMYDNKKAAVEYLVAEDPGLAPYLKTSTSKNEYGIGRAALEANRRSVARRHLARSLRLQLFDYKALVLFTATLLPVSGSKSVRYLQDLYDGFRALIPRDGQECEILGPPEFVDSPIE